jgi:two-component system LytT family response regulator
MKLRILIADDEPLARERLQALLAAEPNIEVVGICDNGRDALKATRRERPDAVFLDVQMPEMDGFAFLKALPPESRPLVVIVTAFEKYAAWAFEVHAVDFLLKPFDRERLRATLHRARERIQASRQPDIHKMLAAMPRNFAAASNPGERISIKKDGRIVLLKFEEIEWIGAAGNYVEIHTSDATHLLLSTLTALERRLPGGTFIRISRSAIINANRLKELRFDRRGQCSAVLQGGLKLSLSSACRGKLEQLLSK